MRVSLVNARSETVAAKPAFRNRRCLVLADGFYEWKKHPDGKRPVYIRLHGGTPFVFGGLREEWRDGERFVESFCILTTRPNELCATVRDRMPLILREADFARWLDAKSASHQIDGLLQPYPAAEMECYPVSPVVNNVRNESAACVEPVSEESLPALEPAAQLSLPF